MTRGETSSLDRALGHVEAQLEEQGKQMAALGALIREQEMQAAAGRSRLYEKIDEQSTTINAIDRRVTKSESVLERIEPLATDFGRMRERSRGFVAAVLLAWTLLGGFLLWVGSQAWEWIIARFGS